VIPYPNGESRVFVGIIMTSTAQQLLANFDQLSPLDQEQVAKEILRRTADVPLLPLADEDLVQLAEELFLTLDKAETVCSPLEKGDV
jgi:hypothetical protein